MSDERLTPMVLVAEDDGDICDLVVMVLEEDDYEVVTAANGAEALELAKEGTPDLCILDVMMPKLDGVELTQKLRGRKATKDVPIILLSARTQWEAVMRGKEAGADPWDGRTLEWSIPSPPPEYNFAEVPSVRSRRPLWDLKHPQDPDWRYE